MYEKQKYFSGWIIFGFSLALCREWHVCFFLLLHCSESISVRTVNGMKINFKNFWFVLIACAFYSSVWLQSDIFNITTPPERHKESEKFSFTFWFRCCKMHFINAYKTTQNKAPLFIIIIYHLCCCILLRNMMTQIHKDKRLHSSHCLHHIQFN